MIALLKLYKLYEIWTVSKNGLSITYLKELIFLYVDVNLKSESNIKMEKKATSN